MKKGVFSRMLAWVLAVSMLPTGALTARAAETGSCTHHTHDGACGYAAGQEASPCDHVCTVESGCLKKACVHTAHEGCTIVTPAVPAVPCDHVCGTETCGYTPAVVDERCSNADGDGVLDHVEDCICQDAQGECGHVCGGGVCAYTEEQSAVCDHTCTAENGCLTLNCTHTAHEGCAYREAAEGSPCTYVCPVCPVQALIDALPETVTAENAEAVRAQLDAINTAKAELTDEQTDVLNISKHAAAVEALSVLEDRGGENVPEILVGTGAFTVSGGAYGTDYKYEDSILTILSGTALTISGTTTTERIAVAEGVRADITIEGLNIDLSSHGYVAHRPIDFDLANESTLRINGTNTLYASGDAPAVHVPNGKRLTICGGGTLNAYGGKAWPGIGRMDSADILIQSGVINAYGGQNASGIGGSWGHPFKEVTIAGGIVTAVGKDASDIGGGIEQENNGHVTVSGNAVVYADRISTDHSLTGGLIVSNGDATVYGDVTLPCDLTVEPGKTLTIVDGARLTIPEGKTLTVKEGGTVNQESSITNNGHYNYVHPLTVTASENPTFGKELTLTAQGGLSGASVAFHLGDSNAPVGTTAFGEDGTARVVISLPSKADDTWKAGENTVYAEEAEKDTHGRTDLYIGSCVAVVKYRLTPEAPQAAEAGVHVTAVDLKPFSLDGGYPQAAIQYGYSDVDSAASVYYWSNQPTLTGLAANTPYYFFTKICGNDFYYEAVSGGTAITTALPAEELPQGDLDIGDGPIRISGGGDGRLTVTHGGNVYSIPADAQIPITGETDLNTITVEGVAANITLRNVNMNSPSHPYTTAIQLQGGANLNLTLEGNNQITGRTYDKALIDVPRGSTLTIGGSGTLNVVSEEYFAYAIGAVRDPMGNLIINGGTIQAGGGDTIIGSHYGRGSVTVNGGTVDAGRIEVETVTVNGGSVNARDIWPYTGLNLVTVTLPGGLTGKDVELLGLTKDGVAIQYGKPSVVNGDGKLHLNLPSGDYGGFLQVDGKLYTLEIRGGSGTATAFAPTVNLPAGTVPGVNGKGELILPPGSTVTNGNVITEITEGTASLRPDGTVNRGGAAITETTKDDSGTVVKTVVTAQDGSTTETVKDSKGNETVTEKNPDGKVTVEAVTAPDGSSVKTEYNPDGSTTQTQTGTDGKTTVTQTDAKGNVTITQTDPDGKVTVTQKDPAGNVTQTSTTEKNPDGSTTETVTDAKGNTTVTEKNPDGTKIQTEYDVKNNPTGKREYLSGGAYKEYIYKNGKWVQFRPVLTEGGGSTYGGKGSLAFRSNDAYVNFLEVKVDGRRLDRACYTVSSGSIRVTLLDGYLRGLSHGEHTLSVVSTNGAAEGKFTVAHRFEWKHSQTEHWKECACGATTAKVKHVFGRWKITQASTFYKKGVKQRSCTGCGYVETDEIPRLTVSPATGDIIFMWVGILAASAAALAVLVLLRRKSKRGNRRKK